MDDLGLVENREPLYGRYGSLSGSVKMGDQAIEIGVTRRDRTPLASPEDPEHPAPPAFSPAGFAPGDRVG